MTTPGVVSARNIPDMIDFLRVRRSSKVAALGLPGPGPGQIDTMLALAARVPDHGKLVPWRFIVFEGDARIRAGECLRQAFLAENPDASPDKLDLEAARFQRAPVVIAIVSSLRDGKAPEWEQVLSAGAACFNLCLSANAQGFATTWLTEWYAYSPGFAALMGLGDRERFAGFVYIGTAKQAPEERERPDIGAITRRF